MYTFEMQSRDLGYVVFGTSAEQLQEAEAAGEAIIKGFYENFGDRAGLNGNLPDGALPQVSLLPFDPTDNHLEDLVARTLFEATLREVYFGLGMSAMRYGFAPAKVHESDGITPARATFGLRGAVNIPDAPIDGTLFKIEETRELAPRKEHPSVRVRGWRVRPTK